MKSFSLENGSYRVSSVDLNYPKPPATATVVSRTLTIGQGFIEDQTGRLKFFDGLHCVRTGPGTHTSHSLLCEKT